MFARKIRVEYDNAGALTATPLKWLDNFSMRSFTNDQIFDDTLPVSDGVIEIGSRVPIELLNERLTDWFRRKGYIGASSVLHLTEF